MDSLRGNRKVLPNYLLDDYVPPPDTKGSSDHESKSSIPRQASTGESSQQHLDGLASTSGEASDTSAGPLGFLPRRKKKLRQACVYCRRSHLVCEEKRPCRRCVKRGIADRCVDPPQEGQLLQDSGWTASTDASSGASSLNENHVSPPPGSTLNNSTESSFSSSKHLGELASADGGQKRKRKLKAEDPRSSTAESHRPNSHVRPQPDYNRHHGGFELSNATTSYGASANHGPSTSGPSSMGGAPSSTLSSAMPPTSAYPTMTATMQMQAEPSVTAKAASSLLLQGQPIFQPPSSAELDSLFSTYFFDVADAFNMRSNGAHHPHPHEMLPPHPAGQAYPHYPQQQHPHAHAPPNLHRQDGLHHQGGTTLQAAHDHRVSYGIPAGPDPRSFQSVQQPPAASQHQLRQVNSSNTSRNNGRCPPAAASASSADSSFAETMAKAAPSDTNKRPQDDAPEQSKDARAGVDDTKAPLGRQKPGDVYSPYPYRKGYASLMRYMTEQNWSEQSIRSVEAALSKIRRLWFSLEDNIQPSSMIQLQAEWAGNVRYFTESVLPFTPVPMLVCRKAGEVYASNQLAQDLFGRSTDEMTGGKISSYELMTEDSASKFFRLYELAVGGTQAEDGTYVPTVGKTSPLYWNAEIVRPNADGSSTVLATRGIFEMKIAPCGLPSLLVCCFIPLS